MTREEAIEWMVFQKEQALAMSDGKSGALIAAYNVAIDALSADVKTKCVARIEIDTEEIVRRIKEEYDITDGWILCSERLPSERGWYLITVQDVNRFTDMEYYYGNSKWYYYGNSEWDEVSSKQEVIAWMPLPKPYKGGDTE